MGFRGRGSPFSNKIWSKRAHHPRSQLFLSVEASPSTTVGEMWTSQFMLDPSFHVKNSSDLATVSLIDSSLPCSLLAKPLVPVFHDRREGLTEGLSKRICEMVRIDEGKTQTVSVSFSCLDTNSKLQLHIRLAEKKGYGTRCQPLVNRLAYV